MSRDLLHYYERELAWLKQAGGDFARSHPSIATSLLPTGGGIEDPHVSRLIEAIAFLNARIQQRLDDDFPEISDALLEHLYPHFLAPLPSVTVVEIIAPEGLDHAVTIAAHSAIDTQDSAGTTCRFRTVYPATLLPYRLHGARLISRPFTTPGAESTRNAMAVLTLQLETLQPDFNLAQSGIDHLRFFIRAPAQYAWPLHELLTGHCLHIAVAENELDPSPVVIPACNLRAAGFDANDTLLSVGPSAQPAYQHLTDFFHFPARFLFVDLHGLAAATAHKRGSFTVFIYLDASERELERNLGADFFSLTATPAVNLFSYSAEPLALASDCIEYPLIPDIRAIDAYEVYAVEKVERIDAQTGERTDIPPFFGLTHDRRDARQFWHHRRRLVRRGRNHSEPGFDSFIAFSDQACDTTDKGNAVVQIQLLCSNRNLPAKLLPGGELPVFRLQQDAGRVQRIQSLLPPTPAVRPALGNGARWRLLSQLNLNLSGLISHADAAGALREMLRLYDYSDSAATRALIDAIDHVQCSAATAQFRCGARSVLCRGVDICITFVEALLAGTSIMLYGAVLEHFLAQAVSLNSFVRVSVKLQGRQDVLKRWPPRAGTRPLL